MSFKHQVFWSGINRILQLAIGLAFTVSGVIAIVGYASESGLLVGAGVVLLIMGLPNVYWSLTYHVAIIIVTDAPISPLEQEGQVRKLYRSPLMHRWPKYMIFTDDNPKELVDIMEEGHVVISEILADARVKEFMRPDFHEKPSKLILWTSRYRIRWIS